MKKLVLKFSVFFFLTLFFLEILVRLFHLAKDTPLRYVDNLGVEKWIPKQKGFSVTGNRNQNFSEFKINDLGFNSYREFLPTKDKIEIALVGDSYFQGFHQDYYNSIGKKIENTIPDIEVYEYGYAGYDFADQLHLIDAYKEDFALIDHIVIYLNFPDDLNRDSYFINDERLALQTPRNLLLQKSKLLVYFKSIGILDAPLDLVSNLLQVFKKKNATNTYISKPIESKNDLFIKNFLKLAETFNYNKNKSMLLLDSAITPQYFLDYLDNNNFNYIDFRPAFNLSKKETGLIYDKHWNNHGREVIAKLISDNILNK